MSGTIISTDELSFTANGESFDLDLTVQGTVVGSGTVTNVGGTVDGNGVNGPYDADGADNLISTTSPYVDGDGVTFIVEDGADSEYNIYDDNGTFSVLANNVTYAATDVSLTVTCFVKGTRISTPLGNVNVESLKPGDAVLCADGRIEPIVWVGKRDVNLTRHPQPEKVRPIRIAPHAFGNNLPTASLFLSPDHAIFSEGVLIPIRYLVNGSSVIQLNKEETGFVSYYHIELAAHDVLVAEGLAVESYLDAGNRNSFNNGVETTLFADFSPLIWDAKGYAPLCVTGPEVERVRAKLSAQALRLEKLPFSSISSAA